MPDLRILNSPKDLMSGRLANQNRKGLKIDEPAPIKTGRACGHKSCEFIPKEWTYVDE
jgi:hypothetical protein